MTDMQFTLHNLSITTQLTIDQTQLDNVLAVISDQVGALLTNLGHQYGFSVDQLVSASLLPA